MATLGHVYLHLLTMHCENHVLYGWVKLLELVFLLFFSFHTQSNFLASKCVCFSCLLALHWNCSWQLSEGTMITNASLLTLLCGTRDALILTIHLKRSVCLRLYRWQCSKESNRTWLRIRTRLGWILLHSLLQLLPIWDWLGQENLHLVIRFRRKEVIACNQSNLECRHCGPREPYFICRRALSDFDKKRHFNLSVIFQ